jgi:hypothetical protein
MSSKLESGLQTTCSRIAEGIAFEMNMAPMLSGGELDHLRRNIIPRPARWIATAVYCCCVVLDVVWLLGLETSPAGVAHFACTARSFGVVSSPLFSEELLHCAAKQCAEIASEPSISIIFLSIKFALAMMVVPLLSCSVLLRPQGLVAFCSALGEFTQEWEAYYRERNLWAKRILIVVAVDFLGVLLSSQATVAEFNTSVLHKLFVEDGLAMLLPATVFVAMIFPTIFSVVRPLRQPIA